MRSDRKFWVEEIQELSGNFSDNSDQVAINKKQDSTNLEGLFAADCVDFMEAMPDECVDLAVTSPPYDNLRDYKGYSFEFERIADGLFRVI